MLADVVPNPCPAANFTLTVLADCSLQFDQRTRSSALAIRLTSQIHTAHRFHNEVLRPLGFQPYSFPYALFTVQRIMITEDQLGAPRSQNTKTSPKTEHDDRCAQPRFIWERHKCIVTCLLRKQLDLVREASSWVYGLLD